MAAIILLATVGCSGASGLSPASRPQAGAMHVSLSVLPESFSLGGQAELTAHVEASADGSQQVHLLASDAHGLRSALVELDYDPAQWHPVASGSSGLLRSSTASGATPLELADFSQPGTAVYAQVLSHPEAEPGFSGSGVLATLRLAPGPAPLAGAAASRTASTAMGDPSAVPWGNPSVTAWPDRRLVMAYDLRGDYDQNGEVNAADLLPLSQHLYETLGPEDRDTLLDVLDGDNNNEINLADVAVIGRNFRERASFKVFRTRVAGELPWDFQGKVITGPGKYQLPVRPHALPLLASGDGTQLAGNPLIERCRAETPLDSQPGYFYVVEFFNAAGQRLRTDVAMQPDRVFQHYWPDWRLAYDAGGQVLTLLPSIPGDYDRNSQINAADLARIGSNFMKVVAEQPDPNSLADIDGNGDGIININDLFIVEMGLGQRCDWLNIYVAAEAPLDPYAPSTLQPFAQSATGRLEGFAPASGSYVWLRPEFEGAEGPCSPVLRIP